MPTTLRAVQSPNGEVPFVCGTVLEFEGQMPSGLHADGGETGKREIQIMTCEHLQALEQAVLAAGIREKYRGAAWSENCREWVYFDCYFQTDATRELFPLDECVVDHVHRGTHDGQERGFACRKCHDALMGRVEMTGDVPVFPGTITARS